MNVENLDVNSVRVIRYSDYCISVQHSGWNADLPVAGGITANGISQSVDDETLAYPQADAVPESY